MDLSESDDFAFENPYANSRQTFLPTLKHISQKD